MNAVVAMNNSVVYNDMAGNEIALDANVITRYITGGNNVTEAETKFFIELCKARKLNPFLKDAYMVKYGTAPAQIIVSKDVFVKRADANENYNGREDGIIILDRNGNVVERQGTFYLKDTEQLVGAWCKVYLKNIKYPIYKSVALSEVTTGKSLWEKQPAMMCNKVALVRALRDAFPNDFSQMYDASEMDVREEDYVKVDEVSEDNTAIEVPTVQIVETVEAKPIEAKPKKQLSSEQQEYKEIYNKLKNLDGGKLTGEHRAEIDGYNKLIKSGDASAMNDCIAYMNNEISKIEFASEAVGE